MVVARRRGVTLIELLVVIGIIVLLIALLLPTLAVVKRRAQRADTEAQLSSIRGAVEAYFSLFRAYPGPFVEERLTNNMGWTAPQNLTVGLMGSMQNLSSSQTPQTTFGGGEFARIPAPVVTGQNYRTYVAQEPRGIYDLADGVQHAPLYVPRNAELRIVQGLPTPTNPWPNTSTFQHVSIPVFFDRYTEALPILYFRRDTTFTTPVVADTYITPGVGAGAAYYRRSNLPYVDSTTMQAPSGTVLSQATSGYNSANITTAVKAPFSTHLEELLTDQTADFSTAAARRPRNMFVLISAGEDRVYGPRVENGAKVAESDDVVIVGGGGS